VDETLPAAWTGLIDTLSEIQDPDVSQLDKLLKALSIVGDRKPGNGLRKAEISTKLAGFDQKRTPDAVSAWTEYADSLSDDEAALRARCEAIRVFKTFTDDQEGSQTSLYLNAVESLLKMAKLVPSDIANLICLQIKELLRRDKVVVSDIVDTLGQLHRLAPGSTNCIESILEVSEEDDGDVLTLGQYRILASKISHIASPASARIHRLHRIDSRTERRRRWRRPDLRTVQNTCVKDLAYKTGNQGRGGMFLISFS